MFSLSTRTKEAIKTGLAMTIAYGIALSMDWEKPYWAGFAVAFISLATTGQSLNKGALRMLGTLVTTVVALILIALFAQDRWLFMLFLSCCRAMPILAVLIKSNGRHNNAMPWEATV